MSEVDSNPLNASKGLDFYTYLTEGYTVEVKKKNAGESFHKFSYSHKNNFDPDPFQLHQTYGGLYSEGEFVFTVKKDNVEIVTKRLRIDIGKISSTINAGDLVDLLSGFVMNEDSCVSFGIYNADGGIATIFTNKIQLYVYATDRKEKWQEKLFKEHGNLSNLFLKNLFFPGSHDAGMFEDVLLQAKNLGNTQNNSIYEQLSLGSRYFDFRPGLIDTSKIKKTVKEYLSGYGILSKIATGVIDVMIDNIITFASKEWQHVHLFVPGCTYRSFLTDAFRFLSENENEIVVVEITYDGFLGQAVLHPENESQLIEVLDNVEKFGIQTGDEESLKSESIESLIANNKRLIILYKDLRGLKVATSYANAYKSLNPNVIISQIEKKLNKLTEVSEFRYLYSSMQLTANGIDDGIIRGVEAVELFTSPLRATKPHADSVTYKYLSENKLNYHNNDSPFLAGNDFYENAFTDVAEKVNRMKLGL